MIGGVTRRGVTRRGVTRRGVTRRGVTSPTWGPARQCKQALSLALKKKLGASRKWPVIVLGDFMLTMVDQR